jgi:hypothetical protein
MSHPTDRTENPAGKAAGTKAADPANTGEAEENGLDLEAPEADAAEQRADVVPGEEADEGEQAPPSGIEADPADEAEQHRVVTLDEDDYR